MANPRISDRINNAESGENRVENLHLDRVVASHPEIGPTPPDGGYGWLIVVSSMVYHITVPGIFTLYGLVILKALREEDHEKGEVLKVWDVDIALVPFIMVVMKLLLESWCRAVVKTFNMPRFMALAGLCLTVAGVLLSSYSTDANSNDHIINIFAGIFAGIGFALTGQQAEVIITHYFRDRLVLAQRLVRVAPSIGNCLVPLVVGYLSTVYTSDAVVMIYGAIIMQNCFFLASFSRPIYIEKMIRSTYNVIRDAVEDDDEVIFSNNQEGEPAETPSPITNTIHDEENADIIVFNKNKNAKEIFDPAIQAREKKSVAPDSRFSSDFSAMFADEPSSSNRFSSDFGALNISNYSGVSGYRELDSIDRREDVPQPLYRETTVNAPQNNIVFGNEMTPGTARRTASIKKNLITVKNMLLDVNFYLYTMLHLCTTYSVLVLGVVFPPLVWSQNPSMSIWTVSTLLAVAHGSALCFVMLCIVLPQTINEKARLCAAFCIIGSLGFYGITLSSSKSFLVIWSMLASLATSASGVLQQHNYNTLNEFDTTATITAANTIVGSFLMIWFLIYNYSYSACFFTATILQAATAVVFILSSLRRRR